MVFHARTKRMSHEKEDVSIGKDRWAGLGYWQARWEELPAYDEEISYN
jgi:hypothetical protein